MRLKKRILMRKNPFRGLGVALITPFLASGELDEESLRKLVRQHVKEDTDFLCVLGTTAETPCLTTEERHRIVKIVRQESSGQLPLLLGAGGNCTAEVVERIGRDDFEGIDGLLIVCPFYNKPTQEGLYRHFEAIAATCNLPIVLYNVPGRTGVNLEAQTTLRLARNFENIVAIKEASGRIGQIEEILGNAPEGFEVLSGDDGITFELLTLGAQGVISVVGNAFPHEFGTMVHAALEGRWNEALKWQRAFAPMYKTLFADGNPGGIKHIMATQQKIQNVLRLPLVPVGAETAAKLTDQCKRIYHID